MYTLIVDYAEKLNIKNENVIRKADELLSKLRSKAFKNTSDSAQIVICLNIAANFNNLCLQEDDACRYTQLSRRKYNQEKRLIEKLLNIDKNLNVADICTQLGVENMIEYATNLRQRCLEKLKGSCLDLEHPQYAAMAVYHVCREKKIPVSKCHLRQCAQISQIQWVKLTKLWEKWMPTIKEVKPKSVSSSVVDLDSIANPIKELKKDNQLTDIIQPECYETWKRRMLDMAFCELRALEVLDYDESKLCI